MLNVVLMTLAVSAPHALSLDNCWSLMVGGTVYCMFGMHCWARPGNESERS